MKNEFNNNASEFFVSEQEYTPSKPNAFVNERINVNERKEYSSQNDLGNAPFKKSKAKKEKQKKDMAFLTKIVSLCAATVIVTTSGVIPLEEINVEFLSVDATENSVFYAIEVPQEKELLLELSNDFTKRMIPLKPGVNEGEIENLVPNMRYTLSVYTTEGVRTLIEKYDVRTLKEKQEATWQDFSYEPAESLSGVFSFTPYYQDKFGEWSDMRVIIRDTIADERYAWEEVVEIQGSGIEHQIDLSTCEFMSSRASVQVVADSASAQTSEPQVLYETEVNLSILRTECNILTFKPATEENLELECSFEFIDENGVWGDSVSNKVTFSSLESSEGVYGTSGYVSGEIDYLYFNFNDFSDGWALLTLSVSQGGETEEIVLYEEKVMIGDQSWVEYMKEHPSSNSST